MTPKNENSHTLSSGERAYRRLYEAILSGELKPGTRLRENQIAEQLGISRTPVREALRRLETQGLLVHEAHKGMMIPTLDAQMVTELYLMREVLEGTAAALTAKHAAAAEIDTLKDMLEIDRGLTDQPEQLARTNRLFHEVLYQGAHNRYLLRSLSALRQAKTLLGRTTLNLPGRAAASVEEHAAIVDAIEQSNSRAAEEAAKAHIRAAHRARLKVLLEDKINLDE